MKQVARKRRHKRVTKKLKGTKDRPRLTVFRSGKNISAQLVNDENHSTITSYSTFAKDFKDKKIKSSDKDAAKQIGKVISEKALKLGVKTICFDRGGYKYHGRVKSLADGAREGGLKF